MNTITLFFINSRFVESRYNTLGDEKAILDLDLDSQVATLSFRPNCNLIVRKTAERLAHSICKLGFLLDNKERIGMGYALQIKSEETY